MIKTHYNDGKKHVHVISYGAGTQSTALLLYALEHGINGVKPDYAIFADTGWEPAHVYEWLECIRKYVKEKYDFEIIVTSNGNIKKDIIAGKDGKRFASLPFYTMDKNGNKGMVRRQCTMEYKILPIQKKIRELLGYKPKERVNEIVHIWKGISIDEIQRVKPSNVNWQVHEHPLVDVLEWDRSKCIEYVQGFGLGTPPQSACIGCPFRNNDNWRTMKIHYPEEFEDAVKIDKLIRELPRFNNSLFLHPSCRPLDEVDFNENQLDLFTMECDGFCGI